ncbi:MAG: dinitrogenase iron-molybdenum cofactor biosynthesis protein [Promethearchaeota archaeon CR_4]|nr:MAG: dinitrogenase iron-molybdenum cofactor biosynthesis protein [Candidatus Lokiarchaeota archaeon CR_4]
MIRKGQLNLYKLTLLYYLEYTFTTPIKMIILEQKVAFCCQNPGGLSSGFDFRFGRCAGLTVVTLEDKNVKSVNFVENSAAQSFGGAGVETASLVGNLSLNALVLGFLGPNAVLALKHVPGLKVLWLRNNKTYTVKEALDLYLAGSLPEIKEANVNPHHGMGMGQGQGSRFGIQ